MPPIPPGPSRSPFSASYSLACLTSTLVAVERRVVRRRHLSSRPCTTTGTHSWKMPAGLALVADGQLDAVERDHERGDPVASTTRALVDGALHAQPATRLAAVLHADLVDVAVVVDGRRQELGDDDAAADQHQAQHGRAPASACRRAGGRRSDRGPRAGSGPRLVLVGQLLGQGAAATQTCATPARPRRRTRRRTTVRMNPMSSISRSLAASTAALGAALGERIVEAPVVERVLHRQHPLAVQHQPHVQQRERHRRRATA